MNKILAIVFLFTLNIFNSIADINVPDTNQVRNLPAKDLYEQGETLFSQKDYVNAARCFLKAAEQGYPPAQDYMGWMYYNGTGVYKDLEKSIKWYMRAAEQGLSSSQYCIGYFYYNGEGFAKNHEKAFEWFLKAANQGHRAAQNYVGCMYDSGEGIKRNVNKAFEWFQKAADQGLDVAQFNLGNKYYQGVGVTKDYDKALFWYKKAADQGYTEALCSIGDLYLKSEWGKNSEKLAFSYYMKAAETGNSDAQNRIGTFYYDGKGTKVDYPKAYYWYKKSADQDNTGAQFNLGLFYSCGLGVPIDYNLANQWFAKFARNKPDNALVLGNLFESGFEEIIKLPKNNDQALYWYKKAYEYGDKDAEKDIIRLLEDKELAQKSERTNVMNKPEPKRIALIIGNGDYDSMRLPNPINDSKELMKKLKAIGFKTTALTNLNKVGIEDNIESFAEEAKDYDVALFYYAGHAVQLNGVNYIIPVKERITNEASIRTNCPTLDFVIQNLIDAGVKNSIIILDACRDNPNMQRTTSKRGYGSKGLASIKDLPLGFLVAYSTQPNEEAEDGNDKGNKNSPYAEALLNALNKPMRTIDDIFIEVRNQVKLKTNNTQIPMYLNNLRNSDLYLNNNR